MTMALNWKNPFYDYDIHSWMLCSQSFWWVLVIEFIQLLIRFSSNRKLIHGDIFCTFSIDNNGIKLKKWLNKHDIFVLWSICIIDVAKQRQWPSCNITCIRQESNYLINIWHRTADKHHLIFGKPTLIWQNKILQQDQEEDL